MRARVIVVTKRQSMFEEDELEGAKIIVAQGDDDSMVLKQSYLCKCPVVSRGCYQKQLKDRRLDSKVRDWHKLVSHVQLRWSWVDGEFVTNYDLLTPSVRPRGVSSSRAIIAE